MTGGPAASSHPLVPPWRDVRVLRVVVQLLTLALVGWAVWWLANNLVSNMSQTRLSFGFGFLDTTAGFDIGESFIEYSASDTYREALLTGLGNTLVVSLIGVILATILGVITGVARLSRNWLVSRLAAGYVELMRNTPLLVQLVLVYAVLIQLPSIANAIALPGSIFLSQRGLFVPRPVGEPGLALWAVLTAGVAALAIGLYLLASRRETEGRTPGRLRLTGTIVLALGVTVTWLATNPIVFDPPVPERFNFVGGLRLSPELTALLVGLVVYTAAFIGEIVRGGIQAVRRGQLEAARAIGLTEMQTLRLVVFPQALRVIVPPLTSQYLNLIKNSSLAIAVGFSDLFSVSRTMANQTGQPISVIVLVMGIYLVISLLTSLLMNIYNRRVQVREQ